MYFFVLFFVHLTDKTTYPGSRVLSEIQVWTFLEIEL